MRVDRHAPGTFCWNDLAAHDRAVAERFYPALLGWRVEPVPYGAGPDEVYINLHHPDGPLAAALYAMDDAQKAMGIPSYWLSYVAVESADDAVARAREAGGAVVVPPFDVMEHGRMAILQDPTGGTLAVWQAGRHPGAGVIDEPGAVCWNELGTADPAAAGAFYAALFGWTVDASMEGYTIFRLGDRMVGGMYRITPEMGPMPAAWVPYFACHDADAAAETVRAEGGTVIMGPMEIPQAGRAVLFRDPQGAHAYAIRLHDAAAA